MSVKYTSYVAELEREFPGFQVKGYQEHWLSRWLWSQGWRMGATAVKNTVYMNERYIGTDHGYELLRHEAVHLRQQAQVGMAFFVFTYFLCLPLGLTARALWEWPAYVETMQVEFEERGEISNWTVGWIADMFAGSKYGWMFPFRRTVTQMLERKRLEIEAQALDA